VSQKVKSGLVLLFFSPLVAGFSSACCLGARPHARAAFPAPVTRTAHQQLHAKPRAEIALAGKKNLLLVISRHVAKQQTESRKKIKVLYLSVDQ
jgi:hypothetical protein